MDKFKIGIIGFGIVGRALQHGFAQSAEFRIYDTNPLNCENTFEDTIKDSEFIFICVPSPTDINTGKCDYSLVENTLKKAIPLAQNTNKVLIVKSTIVIGTTQYLIDNYPMLNIIYNPEFLTERSYKLDFINSARIVLGGDETLCDRVAELYYQRFPMTPICITSATAAEAVKYFSNCMLAAKVALCNEFYDICEDMQLQYNDVITMVLMDGRIGKSHIEVPGHDGKRGFGGKCFPKDVKALITKMNERGVDVSILESVWEYNYKLRKDELE